MAEPIDDSKSKIEELIKATGTSNPAVIGFEALQNGYSAWQKQSGNSVPLATALQALKRDGAVDFSIRGVAANLRHSDQGNIHFYQTERNISN